MLISKNEIPILYIYRITFKNSKLLNNQDAYISTTTNINKQKNEHKRDVLDFSKDTKFYRYVRENGGWKNCRFEILEVCTSLNKDTIAEVFQNYILKYKPSLNEDKPKETAQNTVSKVTNINKYVCICKKSYAHKSSYYKHTNTCLSFQHHKAHKHEDNHTLNELCGNTESPTNTMNDDDYELSSTLPTFPSYSLNGPEYNTTNTNKNNAPKVNTRKSVFSRDKIMLDEYECEDNDPTKLLIEQNEKIKEYIRQVITVVTKHKKRSEKSLVNSLVFELLDQNKTLQKQIIELSKERNIVVNNTNNNQFNLNFFLNEQCKDAINMTDFVNSLEITLDDLTYTRNQGLVEGISKVMIDGLKQMDLYKRPIHCTDQKRDTIYIKDNHTWARDEGNIRLKKAFVDIANKEYFAIKMWMDSNPEWESNSTLQDFHHKMVKNVLHEIKDDPIGERKILKNIERETFIEK